MKTAKRWLALLLSVLLCIGLLPTVGIAVEEEEIYDKFYATEFGDVYTTFSIEMEDNTPILVKSLYINDFFVSDYVADFCLKNNRIYYSDSFDLFCFDMKSHEKTLIANNLALYDLAIDNDNTLYGIDYSRGLAQLYVVSLNNNKIYPTNYVCVNDYSLDGDNLIIEISVPNGVALESSGESFSSSMALSHADQVDDIYDAFENLSGSNKIDKYEDSELSNLLNASIQATSALPAILDLPRLYVTQGANGDYSHQNSKAYDIDCSSSGLANIKAPYDGTVKYVCNNDVSSQCHAIWFESDSVVQYANGTVGKLTILTMHDNDVSDLYAGRHFTQGEVYTQEGRYGYATGDHLHIECIDGGAGSYAWQKRGTILPNDALYLSKNTRVDNTGGVTWRKWNGDFPVNPIDPPINLSIQLSQNTIQLGDSITITPTAENADNYDASIWYGAYDSGERVQLVNDFTGSITYTPTQAGNYEVRVDACNAGGYISANVQFTVSDSHTLTYVSNSGVWRKTSGITGTSYTLPREYPKVSNSYFSGWAYEEGAELPDFFPGETIPMLRDTTLYAVYVSAEKALSGTPVVFYSLNDFDSTGYNVARSVKTYEGKVDASYWSNWSDYSTTAVTASPTVQVRTTPMYRYYYYLCPSCGRHEPFTGKSDCGATITGSAWHEKFFTTPYKNSNYSTFSYTTKKYYTTSLGDSQLWIFSSGNLNDSAIGTKDADGSDIVITQGYSSRSFVEKYNTRSIEAIAFTITPATITYTIRYNANGGSGAPAAQTKTAGTPLTLSTTKPTRSGYTFLGWAESPTATSAQYQPGGSFTKDADTTLYAVWLTEYTNVFDGVLESITTSNGKLIRMKIDNTMYPVAEEAGAEILQIVLGENGLIIAGKYRFWLRNDTIVKVELLQRLETYSVNYNANGGSGAPASQTKTEGKPLTLSTTKPTRSGYTFLGWAESPTATSAQYQPGGSFNKDINTTLYAVWTPDNQNDGAFQIRFSKSPSALRPGEEMLVTVSLSGAEAAKSGGIEYRVSEGLELVGAGFLLNDTLLQSVDLNKQTGAFAFADSRNVNGELVEFRIRAKENGEGTQNLWLHVTLMPSGDEQSATESIEVRTYIPGDLNGDGEVTDADAIYLLYYTFFPELYPVDQDCDFNRDGSVTDADAIYLLYYTFFPELYPIG